MSRKKKGPRPPRPFPLQPSPDPLAMRSQMLGYIDWVRVRGHSEASARTRARSLRAFAEWAEERALLRPTDITRPIVERYQRHLFLYRKKDGGSLTVATQLYRLGALKVFFRYLVRQGVMTYNPAAELELPRKELRLPKAILTLAEVEQVMSQPKVDTMRGIRDRAILETLFSTGMRRRELAQLTVSSVDPERGMVMIRLGKGKKDRLIPIGERAVAWIERYLVEVRPQLVMPPDSHVLFLTEKGIGFGLDNLSYVVGTYVEAAQLAGKSGACHLFRHTMATMMLEGGADIRFIQQMLGHAELTTTQIYTRVAITKLKEVHSQTHPGAKLERHENAAGGSGEGAAAQPPTPAAPELSEEEQREQLLSSLAAEAVEESEDPED